MKKIMFIAALAVSMVACKKDPGSISGNVSYKYNDYQGNKPDVGSIIRLYNVDKSENPAKYETTADLQGNYKIENVIPGDYLLITESKNTNTEFNDLLSQFTTKGKDVQAIFGTDTDKLAANSLALTNLEGKLNEAYSKAMSIGEQKYFDEYSAINKKKIAAEKEVYDKLSADLKSFFPASVGYDQKLEVKKITIGEAQNSQNNTDFGITFKSVK